MTGHFPHLAERARSQAVHQPGLYGDFDFTALPHRLTTDPADACALPAWVAERAPYLTDDPAVELIRTTTLLGDVIADPYAALVATHGTKQLISMLRTACRNGIDAVSAAPPELVRLIEAMGTPPPWIDMDLVEEGARAARVPAAFLSPYLLRGAFLATFTNTYAALPMTLTGALSGKRAARRVHDTAGFFAVTALPDALARHGAGFEAAAMVRLMHSLTRVQALRRPDVWDRSVYGLPIPQIDQMPAGLINTYILARVALRRRRPAFTRRERAVAEFARYRCFLLGLPEELLPTTPEAIVHLFHARAALLRDGFDDATCGALVRSTMAAQLHQGHGLEPRLTESVERSWSKYFFRQAFCNGNTPAARAMSVGVTRTDTLRVALTAPFVLGRFFLVTAAADQRRLSRLADAYTLRVLRRRLTTYGMPAREDQGPDPEEPDPL
ncbi:DUF2236 domain-containing protein [Streptomyces sp. CAI-121]|uniref:oxygenase MpaB family protein n=1 Tax=unclassified Streptomyces TaxID=2593676 RepID=UPI0015877E54|nr:MULTISPECIES: oxygenase MpaB family protein [unclassified Streptomyces]NUV66438.1 DUF2236 domain-containing protein [Streptomyces sp. CAI-121]NUW11880.1 DUF2236 domain-containing protein [Streptomyces sp. CAI-68]